jgi:hypothetical protein
MFFSVSGAQLKFLRAKTPPEEAVGMVGTEVGALFRLMSRVKTLGDIINPNSNHKRWICVNEHAKSVACS